jgi:hypothetical protein
VAQVLERQGYHAWALKGGSAAWRVAGYPVEAKQAGPTPPETALCPTCGKPLQAHGS